MSFFILTDTYQSDDATQKFLVNGNVVDVETLLSGTSDVVQVTSDVHPTGTFTKNVKGYWIQLPREIKKDGNLWNIVEATEGPPHPPETFAISLDKGATYTALENSSIKHSDINNSVEEIRIRLNRNDEVSKYYHVFMRDGLDAWKLGYSPASDDGISYQLHDEFLRDTDLEIIDVVDIGFTAVNLKDGDFLDMTTSGLKAKMNKVKNSNATAAKQKRNARKFRKNMINHIFTTGKQSNFVTKFDDLDFEDKPSSRFLKASRTRGKNIQVLALKMNEVTDINIEDVSESLFYLPLDEMFRKVRIRRRANETPKTIEYVPPKNQNVDETYFVDGEEKQTGDLIDLGDVELVLGGVLAGTDDGTSDSLPESGLAGDPIMVPIIGAPYELPCDNHVYRYFDNKKTGSDRLIVNVRHQILSKLEADALERSCREEATQKDTYRSFSRSNETPLYAFPRFVHVRHGDKTLTVDLETLSPIESMVPETNIHKATLSGTYRSCESPDFLMSEVMRTDKGINFDKKKFDQYRQEKGEYRILQVPTKSHGVVQIRMYRFQNRQFRAGVTIVSEKAVTRENANGTVVSYTTARRARVKTLHDKRQIESQPLRATQTKFREMTFVEQDGRVSKMRV